MAWRISPRVAWQVVAGEVVIVDLVDGRALGLNATGSCLWPLLETRDTEALVAELCRRFSVSEAVARADVTEFVTDLEARGLILTTSD